MDTQLNEEIRKIQSAAPKKVKMVRVRKSFPGHKGIPGHHGGSLPRDAGASSTFTPAEAPYGGDMQPRIGGQEGLTRSARKAFYASEPYSKIERHFDGDLARVVTNMSLYEGGSDDAKSRFLAERLGKKVQAEADESDYYAQGGFWHSDASDAIRGAIKHDIVSTLSQDTGIDMEIVNAVIGQWANTSNGGSVQSLSLQEAAAEEFGLELSKWQKDQMEPWNTAKPYIEKYEKVQEELKAIVNEQYAYRTSARAKALLNSDKPEDVDAYYTEEAALKKKYADKWKEGNAIAEAGNIALTDNYGSVTASIEYSRPITSRENERKILRAMYEHTQKQLKAAGIEEVIIYRGVKNIDEKIQATDMQLVDYKGNVMESWAFNAEVATTFAGRSGVVFAVKVPRTSILSTARTGIGCFIEAEFVLLDNVPGSKARIYMNLAKQPVRKLSDLQPAKVWDSQEEYDAQFKTFPGHKGIPGHHGGSLPRDTGWIMDSGDYMRIVGDQMATISLKKNKWVVKYFSKGKDGNFEVNPHWSEVSSIEVAYKKGDKYLEATTGIPATAVVPEPKASPASIQAGKAPGFQDYVNFIAEEQHLTGDLKDGEVNDEVRHTVKDSIVRKLSAKTGVDYTTVNNIIAQWAMSSNEDLAVLSLQDAAAEELGLTLSPWQKEKLDDAIQDYAMDNGLAGMVPGRVLERFGEDGSWYNRATERKVIRAMYEHTQEQLKKAGIEFVTVYRGISNSAERIKITTKEGSVVNYKGSTMESWTTDMTTAQDFAGQFEGHGFEDENEYKPKGLVLSITVPRANVISTARTGFGCLEEAEFVLLDNRPGTQVKIEYNAYYDPSYKELKSFPGHKGRPGQQGGSLPRDIGWQDLGDGIYHREVGDHAIYLKPIKGKRSREIYDVVETSGPVSTRYKILYYAKDKSGHWELNPHWSEVKSLDAAKAKAEKYFEAVKTSLDTSEAQEFTSIAYEGISPAVRKQMTNIENDVYVRHPDVEELYAFSDNNFVYKNIGDSTSVDLPAGIDASNLTVIHNHPIHVSKRVWGNVVTSPGSPGRGMTQPPSPSDVLFSIERNVKEMRVLGFDSNGRRLVYRVRRPASGWPSLAAMEKAYDYALRNVYNFVDPSKFTGVPHSDLMYSRAALLWAHERAFRGTGIKVEEIVL